MRRSATRISPVRVCVPSNCSPFNGSAGDPFHEPSSPSTVGWERGGLSMASGTRAARRPGREAPERRREDGSARNPATGCARSGGARAAGRYADGAGGEGPAGREGGRARWRERRGIWGDGECSASAKIPTERGRTPSVSEMD